MSDHRVLVPLPSGQWLALSPEVFREALEAGSRLISQPASEQPTDEPLMDAEGLAAALNLPQTWLEAAAREHRIPCVRAGRWVRFKRSEVERALKADGRAA